MQAVQFECDEQDFIYNYGINKGHSFSYSKVNRCYFLSCSAKQLYHNIVDYAFSGKGKAFPAQATLRAELGLGKATFAKYLQELRDKGFITCIEQGANKPLIYKVNKLSTNTYIIHSEVVHSIRTELGDNLREEFITALDEYRESELYSKVRDKSVQNYGDIKNFFRGEFQMEPIVLKENTKSNHIPKAFQIDKDVTTDKGGEKKPKKSKKEIENDITLWNSVEFVNYFEKQYVHKFKTVYISSQVKDRAIMKRLIEYRKDNLRIKEMIDMFIENDYFQMKTVSAFGSQFTQTAIDKYIATGSFPYQKSTSSQTTNDESIDIELSL